MAKQMQKAFIRNLKDGKDMLTKILKAEERCKKSLRQGKDEIIKGRKKVANQFPNPRKREGIVAEQHFIPTQVEPNVRTSLPGKPARCTSPGS
jgi:hypothetical protein